MAIEGELVLKILHIAYIWSFKVSWSVFSPPMATSLLASFKSTGPGGSSCKVRLRVNILWWLHFGSLFSGGSILGQYSVVVFGLSSIALSSKSNHNLFPPLMIDVNIFGAL